jgi:hypothetical protein
MPDPAFSSRPGFLRFASGRTMNVVDAGGEERIEVRAAGGALVIAVRLTDAGPVFTMSGATLEIDAAKKLSLRGESVHVSAKGDLTIEAGGTLYQRAGGSSVREIAGLDRASAGEMEIEVHPGGISLRANDDVDIVGERVRLNSDDPPMPRTWEEHRARHALPVDPVAGLSLEGVAPLEAPPVESAASGRDAMEPPEAPPLPEAPAEDSAAPGRDAMEPPERDTPPPRGQRGG